jgi:chemotaxis protein CheD
MNKKKKISVGISDCGYGTKDGELIVTHSLGSCIGMALYDDKAKVGGMLHYMLPISGPRKGEKGFNPLMFGDTGIVKLFEGMYERGATKGNIRVVIAGGASMHSSSNDHFNIGEKNIVVAQKLLWKNGVVLDGENVRGNNSRTLYLDVETGKIWITTQGKEIVL